MAQPLLPNFGKPAIYAYPVDGNLTPAVITGGALGDDGVYRYNLALLTGWAGQQVALGVELDSTDDGPRPGYLVLQQ